MEDVDGECRMTDAKVRSGTIAAQQIVEGRQEHGS